MLFVLGFGLLLWGLALPLNAPEKTISFITYLYLNCSFNTLISLLFTRLRPKSPGRMETRTKHVLDKGDTLVSYTNP